MRCARCSQPIETYRAIFPGPYRLVKCARCGPFTSEELTYIARVAQTQAAKLAGERPLEGCACTQQRTGSWR